MKRVCKQCGKEFELSEGEIRFYEKKGLELPKRCQQCREQKTGNRPKRTVAAAVVLLFLVSFLGKYIAPDVFDSAQSAENTNTVEAETVQIAENVEDAEKPAEQSDAQVSEPQIPQSTESEGAYETASERTYEFRKHRYLTEHFEKHGDEFPYDTEEAYLQGANNVINNPDALHKLEKEDGDDVYFVEDTNEFVVVSTDGYIRTYFIADIDYYNRQ
ncbi:MAG: hypothetical protein HFH78_08395 [Lachnospiraceae bacterium]|nr:hypothetical protein [Lachnospiraceae bacterium]